MEKSKKIFIKHLLKDDKLDFLKIFFFTYLYQELDIKNIDDKVKEMNEKVKKHENNDSIILKQSYLHEYQDLYYSINRIMHSFDSKLINGGFNHKNLKNIHHYIPYEYAKLKFFMTFEDENIKEITKSLKSIKKIFEENILVLERFRVVMEKNSTDFSKNDFNKIKDYFNFIELQTCYAIKVLKINSEIDISFIDKIIQHKKHHSDVDKHNFYQLCSTVNKEIKKIYEHPQKESNYFRNEQHYNEIYNYEIRNPAFNEIVKKIENNESIWIENKYNIKKMTSHEKGLMGERFFSILHGGDVVGHYGDKTDVITKDSNFSIKTSYTGSWNHHLSYLNTDKYSDLIKIIEEKKSLSSSGINWTEFFTKNACSEDTTHISFQNVLIQDGEIKELENWKIDVSNLLEIFNQKSYIFQKQNMIIHKDGELLFKLQFKKRSNGYQLMIITDKESLNNMVEKNICEYQVFEQDKTKNRFSI